MKLLRGGLIGCGFFARNHLNAWKAIEGVEMAAICDLDADRSAAYAHEFKIARAYGDAEEMLRAGRLDFVDIVTQTASHRPLVELAARYCKGIICQKPLAGNLPNARSMVESCAATGARLMVHENFRWQTPMRQLKQAASLLGPLFFGRIHFRTPYDVYRNQPYLAKDPRFIIADLGVHLLDLARFFLGEVRQLYCVSGRVNPRIRGEDTAAILLKMESGAACVVDLSYASQMEEDLFPQTLVHLEGADGSASIGPHYHLTVSSGKGTTHSDAAPELLPWSTSGAEGIQESVLAIQRHWVECCRTNQEPETSGRDNLRTLELVYAAYESAERGAAIALPFRGALSAPAQKDPES